MIINDNHDVINIIRCVCFKCKHFDRQELKCPAFGDDIPTSILKGENDHTRTFKSQKNNIVFVPVQT